MERNQFTFYKSFAYAVARIKNPLHQLQALWGIIWYALRGDEMDLDQAPEVVAATMEMVIPTLKASRKKASSGKTGGASNKKTTQTKSASSDDESKNKNKEKIKIKEKNKDKIKEKTEIKEKGNAPEDAPAGAVGCVCSELPYSEIFELFWDTYPIQVDREGAMEAWRQINPDEETARRILDSLDEWMETTQWHNENGRYIPHPAAFLSRGYWQNAPGALPLPDYIPELRRRF